MIFRRPKRTVCPCGLKGEVVLNPPRDAAMALARAVKPAARHYHHAAYWRHLYDDNPFRVDPWGVAYMVDGVAEAMVTAVGVPTTKGPGALLAAWMRLPECHSALAGGLVMQPYLGRQDLQLLAYDPSEEGRAFYERAGWARFDAREWSGRPIADSRPAIFPIDPSSWAAVRQSGAYMICRTPEYLRWRGAFPPGAYVNRRETDINIWAAGGRIGDIGFENPQTEMDSDRLRRAIARYANGIGATQIALETNHPTVERAAWALCLKPGRIVPLYWRGADPKGTCYRSLADADFGVRQWW